MGDAILALNGGSSSLKFAVFVARAGNSLAPVLRGEVERLRRSPHLAATDARGAVLADQPLAGRGCSDQAALGNLIAWVEARLGEARLAAVGHRVVHGGQAFVAPAPLTPETMAALARLAPLAPLHQERSLMPAGVVGVLRPDLPQVACFDTAFHRTIDATAARYALPRRLEQEGVHRYGFHGLSYDFVAGRLREAAPALAAGRVVAAHLGNGASLCAMRAGRSVDTTMGFTALDGLVMGTRCGSLDPGVVLYLQRAHGLSVDEVETLLYHESGLLGVSGISSDMRDLLESPDPRAREAVQLFAHRAAREAAALAVSLGGLDGLVFTAGIGEHAPRMRAMICDRLGWLGVALDPAANAANAENIGAAGSRVAVRVVSTDEEVVIARGTVACLGLGGTRS